MTPAQEALLRRLALSDEETVALMVTDLVGGSHTTGLETQTFALARIAALIGAESPSASYQWAVDQALAAGASDADIVGVLIAVAPIVGLARVTSAAPQIALALGYDVDPSPTG